MFINREYIPFRTLIMRGDPAGKLFTSLCQKSYPEDMWEQAYLKLIDYALCERETDWAFKEIGALIEGFRKLDMEFPFDTGYEINEARTAQILWRNEKTLTLLLKTGGPEGPDIVGLMDVNLPV